MRIAPLLLLVLTLAGCASEGGTQPSFHAHINGVYTTFGGVVTQH